MATFNFFTPPRTPLQPLQHSGGSPHSLSQHSSSPCAPSSPLNPYTARKGRSSRSSLSSSGSATLPSNRKAQYKARRPAYSLAPAPEPPVNGFLRDKIMAKCAERVAKDREKAKKREKRKYASSSSEAGSSDVEMSSDGEDEDDAKDEVDDSLYLRLMADQNRRDRHNQMYLFERQVGSSFDPDIEDLAEWEEDERPQEAPEDLEDYFDDDEDQLLSAYEDYLDRETAPNTEASSSQSTIRMGSAATPQLKIDSRNHFLNHLLGGRCPQCHHSPLSISTEHEDAVTCGSCRTTYPLGEAATSWSEDHPAVDSTHTPKWALDPLCPTSILFECSSSDCFWITTL
ncbi:hypothetical protein M407DRAFT_122155 [Tulasnella calospora MUT 4182]|uniref:Uncharacterized protein n=1 Tax=Tulasnella calospora MUT 4182 TaxID=1051891 RepID=A0A0C3QSI7_9AGAM|nr:hypothetical protein M407DRAFT_122155 [Tulasnella calospora MUT 4182]